MRRLTAVLLLASCATTGPAAVEWRAADAYACRYTATDERLPPVTLTLGLGEPPYFATSRDSWGWTQVTLPFGNARGGFDVVLQRDHVELHGRALPTGAPLVLYAREPLQFGRTLRFEPGAELRWVQGDAQGLLFDVPPPAEYRPRQLLRTTLPCERTRLNPEPWVERDGGAEEGEERYLATGVELPVSAEAAAAPVGALFFGDGDGGAERDEGGPARVLERRGEAARVRVELWPAQVEGWIAAAALRGAPDGGLSNVFGVGGLGLRGAKPRGCAQAVPLLIQRGDESRVVGRLLPGAVAGPAGGAAGALVGVTLPELEGALRDGWSWALREAEAPACLFGGGLPARR